MPAGYNPLATNRIKAMWNALMDVRQIPDTLRYLKRTPVVFAEDDEIMARLTEKSIIADVVADDQAAVVRNDHQITLEATKIPNIKTGSNIKQSMLNLVQRIKSGNAMPGEANIFENYLRGRMDKLIVDVRMQMNLMCAGMMLDQYEWSGIGIKSGVITFGTPADLKVTPATGWATSATATPVADIMGVKTTAKNKYGMDYNRITMSNSDFLLMINTTEFRNAASAMKLFNFTADQFSTAIANNNAMKMVAESVLGITIEIDDTQYGRQASDGTHSYSRYLPTGKVLLSNTSDDGNSSSFDFANGIVTETVVGSMQINGAPAIFGGPQVGPVSFATLPNPDLNPPNANLWGVARGFPRKHNQAATAILTVG
ncbi:MAG: major capsid protein [Phycisphaeraceae bacterium JB051]